MRTTEEKLAAIVGWLEQNQSDVFKRGLWDAINGSQKATPIIRKFFDLPLGTRFRYIGGKDVWVILDRSGEGTVAKCEPHDGWVAGQSICSFADTEEECRALEVEVVQGEQPANEQAKRIEELESQLGVVASQFRYAAKALARKDRELSTARREAFEQAARYVNGRKAGRVEGSELWLELGKIERGIRVLQPESSASANRKE